jgi:hypothetical protein
MSDTSSSYYYSSATSTTTGTETTGHRYTTTSHTDPSGNTIVRTAHQDLGEPAVIEERRYDRTGQELVSARPGTGSGISGEGSSRRVVEDLSSDQDYNYGFTSTGGVPSIDTSTNQDLSLLDTSASSFSAQDTNVPATNTPADDISGTYQAHRRSDFDEGAVDPVTGRVYHPED